jgi:hypothetical protein
MEVVTILPHLNPLPSWGEKKTGKGEETFFRGFLRF